jgi:hypothetical protein
MSGFLVETADLTIGPPNRYFAALSLIKRAARWISGPSGIVSAVKMNFLRKGTAPSYNPTKVQGTVHISVFWIRIIYFGSGSYLDLNF